MLKYIVLLYALLVTLATAQQCNNTIVEEGEECDTGDNFPGLCVDCQWDCADCADEACLCEGGCTYTRGYWSTHHTYRNPASQKLPWPTVANIQSTITEDLPICEFIHLASGQVINCTTSCTATALEVHTTAPAGGDAWLILARQYIASVLNTAKELEYDDFGPSCKPENTLFAIAAASFILANGCDGGEFGTIPDEIRDDALCFKDHLDQYNNGEIGPGHCDDAGVNPCPNPELNHCGCTYTRGYWGSPRFTEEFDTAEPDSPRNYDTCMWPSFDEFGDVIACTVEESGGHTEAFTAYTWFDLITKQRPRQINNQWYTALNQYVAGILNLENGACPVDCEHSVPQVIEDCEHIRTLLGSSNIAALFAQGNGVCEYNGPVKFPCSDLNEADQAACEALCEAGGFEEDCDLRDILGAFNEGLIGPGHCNNADGESNPRGCCENCAYLEVREVFLEAVAVESDPVVLEGGFNEIRHFLIANVVLNVVIVVLVIIAIVLVCFYRGKKGYSAMSANASVADVWKQS